MICLQPVFSILRLPRNFKYTNHILGIYAVWLFIVIYIFGDIEFKTVVAKNKHLQWKWLDFPLYISLTWVFFFIFSFAVHSVENTENMLKFLFVVISCFLSYISFNEYKTWGSMWCWVANFVSVSIFFKVLCKI
jgi:hypothetical protein